MKIHFRILAAAALFLGLLTGCGGLGKMEKYIEELGAKAEPAPLIVRGDSVEINITGNFPPKYFHKKVVVEATPVLTYEGGETAFETAGYQGEDAAGNFEVIPFEGGKSFSYTDVVAYVPGMEVSSLELRIYGTKGNKSATFAPLPIGIGVITTPYLMEDDDMPIMSTDNYKRVLSFEKEAVINYTYNKSNVRSAELRDDDIKALKEFISACTEADSLVITGIDVEAYASPEGEITLNEDLAQERAESANAIVSKMISRAKIEVENPDAFYANSPKGEDWEGFKQMMEASSIEDKHLILRVLEMYTDKNKREEEIKNIAKTYKEIENDILPKLRRSQITLSYNVEGYTDEALVIMSKSNPDILTIEELLYSATLFDGLNDKLEIYESAERNFPNDYRGINNVGYVLFMQNKVEEASSQFDKAEKVNAAPEVHNNLGICHRLNGDREGALDHFSSASGAGSEVNYNKGLVHIQNGDYSGAVSNMGSNNTFNTALAKALNGDASGAETTLDNSNNDSAMADYLAAVIAARQNNSAAVITNLGNAIAKDGSLKDKAMRDREFEDFKASFNF